ncbi:MAG: hypothetical protein CMP98_08555 [Gammaproteobacteria bacterium]|nr:hypothetical protein [Gammaproteobacteria bacterium]OUU09052.1 MAG: hypothetical protein CBB94_08780 [Gammaproteobacteria bacterium TMED34]
MVSFSMIDATKLRSIAMAQQGLHKNAAFGRGRTGVLQMISQLGYLQLDSISVVVRAHRHILRTRVPGADLRHLGRLLADREIYEYRFPVAAYHPMSEFRFASHHMAWRWEMNQRQFRVRREDRAMMTRVLDRIREEGPLRSRDFEAGTHKSGGWWHWKPAKRALEMLYYQGDLMVSARDGMEKSFDLTERVVPADIDTSTPDMEEYVRYLIHSVMRAHGFASYRTLTFPARGVPVRKAMLSELARQVSEGELVQFVDKTGEKLWGMPDLVEGRLPRVTEKVRILSPFDNLVTERERLSNVFGFDYQIECFVPEAKRKYGYFCLPVMMGKSFMARMDCRSHRDESRFEIKALYLEPEFATRRAFASVVNDFARAIREYGVFDGCKDVIVMETAPEFARGMLRSQLKSAP